MNKIINIALLFFVITGVAKGEQSLKLKFADITMDKTPTEKDYPEESNIIILKEGFVAFDQKGLLYAEHVVRKILNDRGIDYADIKVPYVKSYSDIIEIKARTILQDGSKIELTKDQFYDVTDFPEYIMYSEHKAKKFTMPSVQPGCVLEYFYIKRIKSIAIPAWEFQSDVPVLLSKFEIFVPSSLRYKILKKRGAINLDIKENVQKSFFTTCALYLAQNIPALKTEPFMPPMSEVVPMLKFTPAEYTWFNAQKALVGSSWEQIGDWYLETTADKYKCDKKLKTAIDALAQSDQTLYEKTRYICEFIRDKFRYVAISIGQGSYIPNDPNKTFDNRYGDCKDLSTLTVAALRYAGIPAEVGLVQTADEGITNKTLCTPDAFNHMIVCVPAIIFPNANITDGSLAVSSDTMKKDKWLIFDPTAKQIPFGNLPWQDKGTDVLVIIKGSSHFVSTNIGKADDNAFYSEEKIVVSKEKENRELTLTYKGLEAMRVRSDWVANKVSVNDETMRHKIISLNPGASVDSIRYMNASCVDSSFTVKVFFHIIGNENDVFPKTLNLSINNDIYRYNPFTELKRDNDISFPYPRKNRVEYSIKLSDTDLTFKNPSDSTRFENPVYCSYAEKNISDDSLLTGYSENEIKSVWSGKDTYEIWKKMFSMCSQFNQKKIMIDKKQEKSIQKSGNKKKI